MSWITIVGIAFGLAMDAFAVSIVVGSRLDHLSFRRIFRLSFHFGLFQFLMPIVGWFLGSRIQHLIEAYDHWVAFGLLAIIGGKMVYDSLTADGTEVLVDDPTRKWTLIVLSIATSIDALAVGLSLAVLQVEVLTASVVIGVIACAMTAIGMAFGRRLGERFGHRMELLGGVILAGIGVKIVLEHLVW